MHARSPATQTGYGDDSVTHVEGERLQAKGKKKSD